VVLINYQEKFIEFIDPHKFKPKKKYQQVPIQIEDTKPFIRTNAEIGKRKNLKLLVDTGASHSLMLYPESDIEIQVPERHIETTIGRALGGEIRGKMARIQEMEMGRYKLKGIMTSYPDPNSYMDSLKASSVARNGSIGGEVLSRFTVIFNYPAGKMYLTKNQSFKKEFQNNLSGLTLKAKGARLKVFEVIDVREKSVSDRAEIMKGDILHTVNGNAAKNLDLNELNTLLNSKPGKKIVLVVDRDGVKLKKTIILEKEI